MSGMRAAAIERNKPAAMRQLFCGVVLLQRVPEKSLGSAQSHVQEKVARKDANGHPTLKF